MQVIKISKQTEFRIYGGRCLFVCLFSGQHGQKFSLIDETVPEFLQIYTVKQIKSKPADLNPSLSGYLIV